MLFEHAHCKRICKNGIPVRSPKSTKLHGHVHAVVYVIGARNTVEECIVRSTTKDLTSGSMMDDSGGSGSITTAAVRSLVPDKL